MASTAGEMRAIPLSEKSKNGIDKLNDFFLERIQTLVFGTRAKVFESLGKGKSKIGEDNGSEPQYMSWFSPGIPFSLDYTDFSDTANTNPDLVRKALAEEIDMTRLVNSVPNLSTVIDPEAQTAIFNDGGKVLWDQYKKVLDYSQVENKPADPEVLQKIEERRNFLQKRIKREDPFEPGKMIEELVDTEGTKLYNQYAAQYQDAYIAYTSKLIQARTGSVADQSDFNLRGQLYYQAVEGALGKWKSLGYKDRYENILAEIQALNSKSLAQYRADLINRLEIGKLTDSGSGAPYYKTSLFPHNLFKQGQADGWTSMIYEAKNQSRNEHSSTKEGGAGISFNLGLLTPIPISGDIGASGSSQESSVDINMNDFFMSFKVSQALIFRPWFDPTFLTANFWRFRPGARLDQISDGGSREKGLPPSSTGLIPYYPVKAMFVKDLVIGSSSFREKNHAVTKSIKAGGGLNLGFVRIGGHGGSSNTDVKASVDTNQGRISIEGTQLVALVCQCLPKAPNPDPRINNWL